MPVVTSICFVISLVLAVLLGPQTRPWTWGPALGFLALSVLCALPVIWRSARFPDRITLGLVCVTVGWFTWRAVVSPVAELAVADLLLLAGAVGTAIVIRAVADHRQAEGIILWSIAVLLAASVWVIARQVADPSFNPIFASRPGPLPSGFFGHYNEGSNFLIGASFLLAGSSLFGKHGVPTRVLWAIVAIAGFVSIYFTRSRGAILAVPFGLIAIAVMGLMIAKREKSKWFLPLLIAVPAIGIAAVVLVGRGWAAAQAARLDTVDLSRVMDNSIRLALMGISFSCIRLHPLAGGGSRSFSWECYQFWNINDHGWNVARPEQVHNELLQAITDYGLIGGALLVILLLVMVSGGMIRTLIANRNERPLQADGMIIGGLAALVGMMVQSSFSFVFHLLPGAMLLGICLGRISLPSLNTGESGLDRPRASKVAVSLLALITAGFLIPYAWKGTQLMVTLWPTFFGAEKGNSDLQRAEAISKANQIWPQAALYKERGLLLHRHAREEAAKGNLKPADEVISDYRKGLSLHPYEGTLSVNLANLLSLLDRDDEASAEYERATTLQGGMELGFRAHHHAANHFLKIARKQLAAGAVNPAVANFRKAAEEYEASCLGQPSLVYIPEGVHQRNWIYDGWGAALEQSGDLDGALAIYEKQTELGSSQGQYRAAILLANQADAAWFERRSSEALTLLLRAKQKISAATELPAGVLSQERTNALNTIERRIQTLLDGKIEPLKR